MASPKTKFSSLVIGCGAIAGGYDMEDISGPNILTHAKAFNTHDGFDLVGCLDIDPEIARNFADVWNVDRAYDSLDDALNDRDYDIISICSSTHAHEYYLRELQKYDVRLVFCEKPITDNIDTAREMAAHYADNMVVNYLRRFDPHIRQLATEINRETYGKFLSGKALYNKGLYNNGSHMINLLHMLVGPVKVTAADKIIDDYWPDDPTISARLISGGNGQIDMIGSDVRDGMIFDLELICDKARIRLSDFSQTLTISPNGETEKKIKTDLNRGMLAAVSNIYDHLTQGGQLYSTADNALQALETCSEIRKKVGL